MLGRSRNDAKADGLAGLILAIIAIFIPLIGIYIGWLAFVLCVGAFVKGERVQSAAGLLVSLVNFLLLSPSLWVASLFERTAWMAQATSAIMVAGAAVITFAFWRENRPGR